MSSQTEKWYISHKERVLERPFVAMSMEQVRLPKGQGTMDWPKIYARDYVNVLAFNHAGEAMIVEDHKQGDGWSGWQVVGSYLEEDEDPYTAVQRQLLERTGYTCNNWFYLGSYTANANQHGGIGHFFYATGAKYLADPNHQDLEGLVIKWVSVTDLKCALIDGRIASINYATNIAIALLMMEKRFH